MSLYPRSTSQFGKSYTSPTLPAYRGAFGRQNLRLGWTRCGSQEDPVARTKSQDDSRVTSQTTFDGAVESSDGLLAWRKKLLWRLLAFVIPASSITLADPLMSLVDTLCIGRYGTTIELAALGPNTVVFNFTSYIFFSIGLATNTLVGRCLREGHPNEAGRVVTQAIGISIVAGTLILGILELTAPALIAATGTSASVVPAAVDYLRIRALACPVVLCIISAQSGLLAQKNSLRPSIAIMAAAAVNIALDILLIKWAGIGIRGAAIATVISQYLCFAMLLPAYMKRDALVRLTYVAPRMEHVRQFASCIGPIFVVIAAKNLTYLLIQSTATSLHFLLVAAHQAMWSLWALVCFCCTPWEQAALAFIPSSKSPREKREIGLMLVVGCTFFGIMGGLVCSLLPNLHPQLLSVDPRLWDPLKSVTLPAFVCMVLVGLDVAVSGILLAENQVLYLARSMVINLAITSTYLFTVGQVGTLPAVWWGLVLFFFCRVVQGYARMAVLSKVEQAEDGGNDKVVVPT